MSNYKCSYGKNCECKTDEEKSTCDLAFETKTKMSKEEMTQEDKDYLWTLMPQWVRRVPSDETLDKTFFATLSREGDLEVHNRVAKLLNQNKD